MTGIAYLIEAFAEGDLVRPRPQARNLVDLSRAVAHVSGVEGLDMSDNAREIAAEIGDPDHLALVLVDGMGMNVLESLPSDSFLRRHLWNEMQTVFPSTTAVALTSLATGQWPGAHAVTGWWTHLPALGSAATILSYTTRANNQDLLERGIAPKTVFPAKPLWKSMTRDVRAFIPKAIAHTTYSTYFTGGRDAVGYESVSDAVDAAVSHISGSDDKTFSYLYFSRVDSEAHRAGITGREVAQALREVNAEVERLRAAIGDQARIVVTADHGFLDAAPPRRHTLRLSRQLKPLFRLMPSGDARVMYLYTLDWARERARRYFEQRFDGRFMVVDMDDAIAVELFGPDPPTPEARERLGDLVVISAGEDILEFNASRGSGRMLQLNGHHSGLSPDEMMIPLVIA